MTSVGVERWKEGDVTASVHSTTVAGFPAVVAAPSGLADNCSVEVDVSIGQLLDVQLSDGGGKPPIPQEELCTRAEPMAALLVMSLIDR